MSENAEKEDPLVFVWAAVLSLPCSLSGTWAGEGKDQDEALRGRLCLRDQDTKDREQRRSGADRQKEGGYEAPPCGAGKSEEKSKTEYRSVELRFIGYKNEGTADHQPLRCPHCFFIETIFVGSDPGSRAFYKSNGSGYDLPLSCQILW